MAIHNVVKSAIENGGRIIPLIVNPALTNGTGLLNPSVLISEGRIIVNIRHVQYTLYHTNGKYNSRYGPLAYFNPDNDCTLTTKNYLAEIEGDKLRWCNWVDTSKLDVDPLWEFVGLEDARLVEWDSKIYLCGVRRDTTTNGVGRMELSEIKVIDNGIKEISRFRIPTPFNKDSYCEKNWMPILDKPYHFMKWCNPVEVVKANIGGDTEQVFLADKTIPAIKDFRGGSQVIRMGDMYYCIVHETNLWFNKTGQKDGVYRHRILQFDLDFNLVKASDEFDFMTSLIEFCCGLAEYGDEMIITFGVADNSAYLLRMSKEQFFKILYE